jgi:hypothetical protein
MTAEGGVIASRVRQAATTRAGGGQPGPDGSVSAGIELRELDRRALAALEEVGKSSAQVQVATTLVLLVAATRRCTSALQRRRLNAFTACGVREVNTCRWSWSCRPTARRLRRWPTTSQRFTAAVVLWDGVGVVCGARTVVDAMRAGS